MKRSLREEKRHGFTLTEIAIVMGIMGLILGAIWVAAGSVSASKKTSQAAEQVMQILNNYRGLYTQHGIDVLASTDVTCTGVNAGFFPGIMGGAGCTTGNFATYPSNPWGGTVMVYALPNSPPNTYPSIVIYYGGLSNAACNQFADSVLTTGSSDLVGEGLNAFGPTRWLPPYTNNAPWSAAYFSNNCRSIGAVLNTVIAAFSAS